MRNDESAIAGGHILAGLPQWYARVRPIYALEGIATGFMGVMLALLGSVLALRGATEAALSVLALGAGAMTLLFTFLARHQLTVTDRMESAIELMTAHWSRLMEDELVRLVISGEKELSTLKKSEWLQLRAVLSGFLGAFSAITHYIRRGYVRHYREFAAVYEGIAFDMMRNRAFAMLWRGEVECGLGPVRREFGEDIVRMIDAILSDLDTGKEAAIRKQYRQG